MEEVGTQHPRPRLVLVCLIGNGRFTTSSLQVRERKEAEMHKQHEEL